MFEDLAAKGHLDVQVRGEDCATTLWENEGWANELLRDVSTYRRNALTLRSHGIIQAPRRGFVREIGSVG
jgi:hypothetical protein